MNDWYGTACRIIAEIDATLPADAGLGNRRNMGGVRRHRHQREQPRLDGGRVMGVTNPDDHPLTVEWNREASPAVWAEIDRYTRALAAMQCELAQCIEKRDMLLADEPKNPFMHDDELRWTGGKIAGLTYAINAIMDGVPQ